MSEARTTLEGGDADAIKAAGEKLSQAAMKMGEALYKAQSAEAQASAPGGADEAGGGGAQGGAGGQGPGGKSDKVVDADFEEVDPNKKKSG